MGYKDDDKCIQKAYYDERLFVLMARDPSAPAAIIEWIKNNIGVQPREKLQEAFDAALEMHETQKHFFDKKNREEMDKKFSKPNTGPSFY